MLLSDCMEMEGTLVEISTAANRLDQNATLSDLTMFDDDGRIKRQGTMWTAFAHMVTSYQVLTLAGVIAQLGWIAGPVTILAFSFVTCYTSCLLADCCRSPDPYTGRRNCTYTDVVKTNLDALQMRICGFIQYANLVGTAIGYTIFASMSMAAIGRSTCVISTHGHDKPCHASNNLFIIVFGAVEILLSQVPDFEQIWWLSIVETVMSLTYSIIGVGLGIAKIAELQHFGGSLTGATVGTVTKKLWNTFQAVGNIACAYSFSLILVEIQDTLKSPPAENKTMKKATLLSVATTTVFYMLCGCIGYAAFGDNAPENLLTGFGSYNPFWLVDIANAAIAIHLVVAYQAYGKLMFSFIEGWSKTKWQDSHFINNNYVLSIPLYGQYDLNIFRLVWTTGFVVTTTFISMLLPFFNNVVGLLGVVAFWPLTVYFPVTMHIAQNNIRRWSSKWVAMQILTVVCLVVSVAAVIGSTVGALEALKAYKPFKTIY